MAVFVSVENQNDFDAIIYTYGGGRWTRLGQVETGSTLVLPFSWDRPEVRFVIELVGNDEITSRQPEGDARRTFAADVHGTVPCHLTAPIAVESGLTLALTVVPELSRNAGGSRCQPRRSGG
jgi:hypothetical protein